MHNHDAGQVAGLVVEQHSWARLGSSDAAYESAHYHDSGQWVELDVEQLGRLQLCPTVASDHPAHGTLARWKAGCRTACMGIAWSHSRLDNPAPHNHDAGNVAGLVEDHSGWAHLGPELLQIILLTTMTLARW